MDLVDLIVEKRNEIKAVCAKYGATAVRVFGSCARNDYDDKSDIDVLVKLPRGDSGLEYLGRIGDYQQNESASALRFAERQALNHRYCH